MVCLEGLKSIRKDGAGDSATPVSPSHEPPKSVLRWNPGEACRREALAVLEQDHMTSRPSVDAVDRKIVSWKELKDVEPNLILEEIELINDEIKEIRNFRPP